MNDNKTNHKDLFNLDRKIVYLNSAYMGLLPKDSVAKGIEGLEFKSKAWEIEWKDFYAAPENTRKLFANIINSDTNSIFFVPSASYGFATFAKNFNLTSRKTILLLEEEFPSNVWVWKDLAQRDNGNIKFVKRPKNDDWISAILENINDQTALISVPNCHWTDGGLIDLLKLSKECKNKDIALTIDGTQSVGAMPIDIKKIMPDLLVVSGYKWCLGPYSLGAAYIDKKYHDGTPIEHNWMAKYPLPEDNYVPNMTKYEDFTIENARRFDFGQRGNFHLMPVFEESLSLINRLSPEYIYAYVGKLNEEIIKKTSEIGFTHINDEYRAKHYLGLRFENEIPDKFIDKLMTENIYISSRGKRALRVTPHIWNDYADVDKFVTALSKILR